MSSRFFSWEWYCSLFPSKPKKEIDPFLWRCACGHKWKFNKLQLLRMYLQKNYIYTCPQCQRKMTFRMITHVVKDIDSEWVKDHNRWLE